MASIIIAGFSPNDRVPGFRGETLTGVGPISAASLPRKVLVVGCMGSGATATGSRDVDVMLSDSEADAKYGQGSEIACMVYATLQTTGVSVYGAPIKVTGSPVAATATITFAGSWTVGGNYYVRVMGETAMVSVASTDSPTNVATAVAAAINAQPQWPVLASSVGAAVTVTCKTATARGNLITVYQDTTKLPSGCTATLASGNANNSRLVGGVFLSGGISGTEDVSGLLSVLSTQQYDLIVLPYSAGDTTTLNLWKSQIDTQSGPTTNILQQVVLASNDSLGATQSLATSLNHARMQVAWLYNSEMWPSTMAATLAAVRADLEQQDPATNCRVVLKGVPPQTNKLDWPSHATLVSAINNGVSPLLTQVDGSVKVGKSIVTHCLTGTIPDYSTHATADITVADFVRLSLRLLWETTFQVANPRVADDPPEGAPQRPSGVATPRIWNSAVLGVLRDLEAGVGFPAPIIIDVDAHLPTSTYDKVRRCIMSAVEVVAAPSHDQIGVSVRQHAS